MVTMKLPLAVLLLCMSSTWAYKILFVFPAATRSNDVLGKGVVWALLKAGHEVTWAATYKQEAHPNLTIIDLPEAKKIVDSFDPIKMAADNNVTMSFMKEHTLRICTATAQNAELRKVLVEKQFDAVMTTFYLNEYDAGYAAIQQVPWIFFSTVNYHPMLELMVDEVRSIPTTPIILNECETPMSLPRRWLNGLMYMFLIAYNWYDQPNQVAQYESMFSELAAKRGVPLPPFEEAKHNVSILLVNSHESLQNGYSSPPNVVNIAGYHISEHLAPLPKDLQELMDKSKNGVIFFSMGSILRAAGLDPKKRDALIKMFGKLPYTVIWKYEEPLDNLPPNVHIRPWLPQPTVLAHKNTVAFITHGGQSSTVEAIHAGMPMVVVPVGGDQHANAERAVRMGVALQVDYYKDTLADDLEVAVKELLGNDKYREKAKFLSKLFRTRPVPPAKLIPFYVELAIETKGAYHLRSLSLKYSWYERWMLDFVLAVLGVLAALAWLVKLAVTACVRRFSGKKQSANKKKKQ
ncbi:UDP-glucosyltransferase 2-like [Helicoverpa zea]|uniref:UDP-glucosyltransferase 2-like n=1 Tax=Helicoverpa zea TaxID=7113 RepID=UPI001F5796B4|nr:UDP-glucosyltransferase 2-like [Helicoverpa zea]XP_047039033.1 UDP-glucosyltransferase 2-like [Helicoverpa zea]XP_047039034.1 UDP-glucosyltransferase 2-like [Helicoverpa zea]